MLEKKSSISKIKRDLIDFFISQILMKLLDTVLMKMVDIDNVIKMEIVKNV